MPIKKFLIFAVVLLLTGCGYHLRGAVDLPSSLKNVYLEGGSPQLREQFKKALRSTSAKLVSAPAEGGLTVRILDEDSQTRSLSLSSSGKSNEFELGLRVDYDLLGAGNEPLLERQPIELRRSFYYDQQVVMATDSEENTIRTELYQQVVTAIINRARMALAASGK